VKSLGPLLAAGTGFAGAVALGLGGGILIAGRAHQPAWVLGGLVLGLAAGSFVVVRALLRST